MGFCSASFLLSRGFGGRFIGVLSFGTNVTSLFSFRLYYWYSVSVCPFFPIPFRRALEWLSIVAVNTVIMFWAIGPFTDSLVGLSWWTKTVYPVTFAQNILTTGLIVWKILRRHRGLVGAGVRNAGSRLKLTHLVRILIESAMLYTVQLFITIVLNHRGLDAQVVVRCAMVPTIGKKSFPVLYMTPLW